MLKIKETGIIFNSSDNQEFRHVTFKDEKNDLSVKYVVFKKTNPYLWKNILKDEKNRSGELTLAGHIEHYKGLDIVVFEGETVEGAYEKQKWRLVEENKISRKEAIEKIGQSEGYITNKNVDDSMTPRWIPLDEEANRIKLRYYRKGKHQEPQYLPYFTWSEWFMIID